ncbi:FAD-binding oxidoreductase [Xanthobacter dioxanivorans]|uniref:FAD-binding oxidoreductase n=1 Tax=Xanthobacter dioxanivorans TaxID=2528964 RepID=A0A974PKW1_9HYPH|nr:FAD-dependent oxidoreductase [Xanthobacter dioxanivorans]QRG05460.1 FAD-binding oxidoreductase [Xanthobacter dioxanivorans]
MTQTVSPRAAVQQAPASGRSGAAPKRTLDCDVCVVGDDVAGLVVAGDLASRGRDVILLSTGEVTWLPLDGVLAPGFALPTLELVARVGEADAQELLILSAHAAERGLRLAEKAGVSAGPRGALAVARAHAADALVREHEIRQKLAPDSTVLIDAQDVAALLGTSAFAAALGVVPAERIATAPLRAALETAARAAGVRFVPIDGALSADLNGLRKYITTSRARVRAFQVVVSGAGAFARMGTRTVQTAPWVCGIFRLPGVDAPYAGLVEERGPAGARFHWTGDRLAFAASAATTAFTRVGAARVVRRHAREVYAEVGQGVVEGGRARLRLPDTGGMPLIHEGERGVWYALASSGSEITHGFMAASLIVGAIAERDDRIALLQPFAAAARGGWAGRIARFAGFWHARLAAKLYGEAKPIPAVTDATALPEQAPVLPPALDASPAKARRRVAAATSASRRAARAALHAASGWAEGLAARAAAEPRRRRLRPETDEDVPPQRR